MRDAAAAIAIAALVLTLLERGVAMVHGLAGQPLSWTARAALLSLHALAVLGCAALVAGIGAIAVRGRPRVAALLAAGVLATAGGLVGHALAAGPWIARQWFSGVVAWGPAIALAAAGIVAKRWSFRRGRAPTITCVAIAIAAAISDAVIAVGHHPAFHLGAWGTVVAATTIVALREAASRVRPMPRTASLVAAVVGIVGIVGALQSDGRVRAELLLRSGIAREILRATTLAPASRLAAQLRDLDRPPPSVPHRDGAALPVPAPPHILVVTIDALRADALPPVRSGAAEHARDGDTPNLDAFAADAFAFRHAYAPASFTMRSLPAIMRSRPPFEDPEALGPSLPRALDEAGYVSIAIVDRYFIEEPEGRAILDGFEVVDVHATAEMREGVGQLLAAIDARGERPFFAWMHLFATHAPGYAGRPLGGRDGTWPQRYRKSLRWVDREVGRLLRGLDARGLAGTTVVVVASDHGEGLGDNGIDLHGETVFEEEVRAPLIVRVPDATGRTIDATVSLVDLFPTLVDLAGMPADPRHAGRSWRPLMLEDGPTPDVLTMSRRDGWAIVRGRDKLVYDAPSDVMLRFDLAVDPTEEHDLYDERGTLDRALVSALVRAHPALFARELDDDATRALLRERLLEIDPAAPGDRAEFLLRLVALADDHELVTTALAWFPRTDDATRLAIVEHLSVADREATSAAIASHLRTIAGTPAELAFVGELARREAPPFASALVAERLSWWLDHGDETAAMPWLDLVRTWSPKRWHELGPPLLQLATSEGVRADVLRRALAAARGLVANRRADMRALAEAAARHLAHADPSVRAAACTALIDVGTVASLSALTSALRRAPQDVRVRQACLHAAASAGGDASVDLVIEQAADPQLTFTAIRSLEALRSPRAIPFLQATIAREKRGRIHAAATLALRKTLEGR